MSSEELKEKNTCQHCDGFGGQGCGYVPEQKGMLPSMCGYCDGTGVVKENRIKKKLQDSLDSLKWNTWNRWSDPDLNDVYSNGMTGGVASFHDCVYEALNQSYEIEQLRDIFFSLPKDLVLVANQWGLSDTEFREAVYSWLCKKNTDYTNSFEGVDK